MFKPDGENNKSPLTIAFGILALCVSVMVTILEGPTFANQVIAWVAPILTDRYPGDLSPLAIQAMFYLSFPCLGLLCMFGLQGLLTSIVIIITKLL